MITEYCVACGNTDSLENHHLVPKSCEGSDDDNNLLTLCFECHGNIHGMLRKDIAELTRAGLARAKERGVKLGGDRGKLASVRHLAVASATAARVRVADERAKDIGPLAAEMRAAGASLRTIAA